MRSTVASLCGQDTMTLGGPQELLCDGIYTKTKRAEGPTSPSAPRFLQKATYSSVVAMAVLSLVLTGILFGALGSASLIPATASRRTASFGGRPKSTYTNRKFILIQSVLTLYFIF